MKKTVLTAIATLAILTPAAFAADVYAIDSAHSNIGFQVRHFGLSKVRGEFTSYDVQMTLDESNLAQSSVQVTIDAASIDTRNEQRDNHLRSEDFLHVEEHPEITFESTEIEALGEGEFLVTGDLTIRGVTQEVEIPVTLLGPIPYSQGTRVGVEGAIEIDRREYGVSWNRVMDRGGLVVGNEVDISFSLEAVQEAPAADAGP